MRIIACIEDPDVIEKILTHLDKTTTEPQGPGFSPCRSPPQRGSGRPRDDSPQTAPKMVRPRCRLGGWQELA